MEETPVPSVVRELDLDVEPDEMWHALVADHEREAWLGGSTEIEVAPGGRGFVTDPDGTRRDVLVDEVVPGRRLTLDWWTDVDPPSHVEFEIAPMPRGCRLRVTERPLVPLAQASAAAPVIQALASGLRTSCLV